MEHFYSNAIRSNLNVAPEHKTPAAGILVTVRRKSDNGIAVIYSDNGVTTKSNPITTGALGEFDFYASNDNYKLVFSDGTESFLTLYDKADDVVDNLTSNDTVKKLSANQGRVLAEADQALSGDLTLKSASMSEAEFNALAEQRIRDNAGSGYLEPGAHPTETATIEIVDQGIYTDVSQSNLLFIGSETSSNDSESRAKEALELINGVQHKLSHVNSSTVQNKIKLPPVPDGTKTYNSDLNTVTTHADSTTAFASETAVNKVITSRKDVVLMRQRKSISITSDDAVFPLGNRQYGKSTWNGIPLQDNTPQSESAFGAWDTVTQGKSAVWSVLSEADKLKFIQDADNNIYLKDGDFVYDSYQIVVFEGKRDYANRSDALADLNLTAVSGDANLFTDGTDFYTFTTLVQRLNSGLNHPSHNPIGTKLASDSQKWNSTAVAFNSNEDCFNPAKLNMSSGLIGNVSGSDTQYLFSDAVYAGQVDDVRLPSKKPDLQLLRCDYERSSIAGTMRGKGKIPFTKVFNSVGAVSPDYTIVNQDNPTAVVTQKYLNPEYDSLPWCEIIAPPAVILAALPNGCVGSWNPNFGSNGQSIELSRKFLSGFANGLIYSDDNGSTWSTGLTADINTITNEKTFDAATRVNLCFYESLADFTKPENNSYVVGSVGDVVGVSNNNIGYGNRLMPSVIGEVAKANSDYFVGDNKTIFSRVNTEFTLKLEPPFLPKHVPLFQYGSGTNNNSKAVKALSTLTEKDGLLYLQYHGCELQYNGVDWGDNEAIPIIDGESTKTDENSAIVKTFCHHSINPIGIA